MAWTINNGKLYFNTKLYTGNNSTQSITGVGFQPDWVWVKQRGGTTNHKTSDIVRGATKALQPNDVDAEATDSNGITAFNSDGFSLGAGGDYNSSSASQVSWNWLAAGTAPSNTYIVKVVSDGGNKYRFDNFGASAVTLEISEGGTFTFDQSDSSNNGHPLRFSTTSNGTHGGGSEYTTGVTTNGTPGQAGAYTRITVAASAPTLYYYCTQHSGMGGQANTPVTNSFSNFAGTIQSNISPNTTSGFSIVSYTGTGSNATIGHGLGSVPKMIIVKDRDNGSYSWHVYHVGIGNTKTNYLDSTSAPDTGSTYWNNTTPTSSVFSVGSSVTTNKSGDKFIAYCFAEKQGYSKFGSYTGNGNDGDGPFIYTGFKLAFVIIKKTSATGNWILLDSKRSNNVNQSKLFPDTSGAENTDTGNGVDLLSNGFKCRRNNGETNEGGASYIYMAFAENPFTSSAGTPVTAR